MLVLRYTSSELLGVSKRKCFTADAHIHETKDESKSKQCLNKPWKWDSIRWDGTLCTQDLSSQMLTVTKTNT